MGSDRRDELRAVVADAPFYRWFGLQIDEVGDGSVTLALDLEDHHLNLQGLAHGGVIATLADAAMGFSLRSAIEPGRRHVSAEIGVHYLRPVTRGRVRATGRAVRIGREIAYAEADVLDGNDRLLARADGTYSVTRAKN
ncbi:MAG: PaaI family thioesterase [Actinomycetota bacterium]